MVIRAKENLVGARAFLVGIILAIAVGIIANENINPVILSILALLGLVVGYFVDDREANTFLMASVSLVIVSFAGIQGLVLSAAIVGINIGNILSTVLGALLVMFVPATIVVALKTVFAISQK